MADQQGQSDEKARLLWIGDPGSRDALDVDRATYIGPAKAFCPCDTGNPQDCKPEEWRPAHSPRPPCERCGRPLYSHQGNYCRRPTPWRMSRDDDWIWHALINRVPWTPRAVAIVEQALAAQYGSRPGKPSRGESPCCPGAGSMAHVRGCRNHPETDRG